MVRPPLELSPCIVDGGGIDHYHLLCKGLGLRGGLIRGEEGRMGWMERERGDDFIITSF